MVKQLQLDYPIGKQLIFNGKKGEVIGVAKDFMFRGSWMKLNPVVLYLDKSNTNYMLAKLAPSIDINKLKSIIKEKWSALYPNTPFDSTTLEDYLMERHRPLFAVSFIFSIIYVITLFIACMGIFGLSAFITDKRKKEIGIRKTLGASTLSITRLFLNSFLKQIIL